MKVSPFFDGIFPLSGGVYTGKGRGKAFAFPPFLYGFPLCSNFSRESPLKNGLADFVGFL